jgi:hypothetical protein
MEAHILVNSDSKGDCDPIGMRYKRLMLSYDDFETLQKYTKESDIEKSIPTILELNSDNLTELLQPLNITNDSKTTTGL